MLLLVEGHVDYLFFLNTLPKSLTNVVITGEQSMVDSVERETPHRRVICGLATSFFLYKKYVLKTLFVYIWQHDMHDSTLFLLLFIFTYFFAYRKDLQNSILEGDDEFKQGFETCQYFIFFIVFNWFLRETFIKIAIGSIRDIYWQASLWCMQKREKENNYRESWRRIPLIKLCRTTPSLVRLSTNSLTNLLAWRNETFKLYVKSRTYSNTSANI